MKKLLVFILTMSMLISNFVLVRASNSKLFNEILATQELSIKQYEKMIKEFEKVTGKKEGKPEYYGGCYIDDWGDLVVLLTDDSNTNITQIKSYTQNNKIKIKKVKFSETEMYETISLINSNYEEFIKNGVELISVSDDVINNQIVVGIKDLNKEKIKLFEKIVKSNMIIFKEDNKIKKSDAYDIKGGYEIKGAAFISTLGFCATRQKYLGYGQYKTIYGFVSATHGLQNVGTDVYYNNNSLSVGKVELSVLASNCDAAFIETNGNANLSDDVSYTDIDAVNMSSLPVGTYVTAYCSQQGVNAGKILNISASDTFDVGGYAYDLVSCDYAADPGDSGAPIMYGKTLLGIHKGGDGPEYFTKYSQIQGSLNCTPYIN